MKKTKFLGLTFVFMLSIFASGLLDFTKAYAALDYPSDTSPYTTGCVNNKPITYETKNIVKSGKVIGYVQLRGSAGCHTAWGYIYLNSAAPSNRYADVYIERNDGAIRGCENYGGNGEVNKGEHSCYTPQLYDLDPKKAYAIGFVDQLGKTTYSAKTGWH